MKSKFKIEQVTRESSVLYHKTTLSNGLTIISEEIKSVESFALGIGVKVGSRDDYFNLPGIAHFLEHSVYRRTKTRTSRQISNLFDSIGAYSNAYTTKENTIFYVRAIKEYFSMTFEILADIIINPIFKVNEINKERQIIIEEIKSYDDDPEEFAFDLADNTIFKGNTLGNGIDGTIESLKKIKAETIYDFHKKHYIPSNLIISVAGNIPHNKVVDEAEKYFGNLPAIEAKIERTAPNYSTSEIAVGKSIQQAHLILGKQVSGAKDKDRYAISLMNIIFGDGLSSRIYQSLREKHGLAYSVFSNINLYSDVGALYLYIATDDSNLAKSEDLLFYELNKLKSSKITKTELNRAKEQLKTGRILDYESMSNRMQALIKNEIILGGYENISQTLHSINTVSIDDLLRLACQFYNTENWSKIIVQPE